ncbi:hypothetical protein INR49_011639 [Caranx melampygus]|nr:hypothetical protein INR49_011639 [Caranx melampygus]
MWVQLVLTVDRQGTARPGEGMRVLLPRSGGKNFTINLKKRSLVSDGEKRTRNQRCCLLVGVYRPGGGHWTTLINSS